MTLTQLAKKLNLEYLGQQDVEQYFLNMSKYVSFNDSFVVLDDSFCSDELELILEVLKMNETVTNADADGSRDNEHLNSCDMGDCSCRHTN